MKAGALRPRARFFGEPPASYQRLNSELLAPLGAVAAGPPPLNPAEYQRLTSTDQLDREVRVVLLPEPIPPEISAKAISGMEALRAAGLLVALRGNRPTDLPRPQAGRMASQVEELAPGLVALIGHVERFLHGGALFVRAIKLDDARASTTATSSDPAASNLHFDAEKSSLSDYAEPVFQFYLNGGQLERQFRILPLARDALLASVPESDRRSLPLIEILEHYLEHRLERRPPRLETIPVPSGALAIFDGRQFAHDAGKNDIETLVSGRIEPASEPDLVIALDTIETGYHQGHYRPELPFFEDSGFPQST